jgi:hypothetical protein
MRAFCAFAKASGLPINVSLISFWNNIQHLYNKECNAKQANAVNAFL